MEVWKLPSPYLSRLKLQKELEKKAQIYREKQQKCDSLMKKIDRLIEILKGRIPLDDINEDYKKAKNYYGLKDFDATIDILEKLQEKVQKRVEEVYEDEVKKIESIIRGLSGEEIPKIRADISSGRDKIKEEPEESFEILDRVKKRIEFVVEENVNRIKRKLIENVGKIDGMGWVVDEINRIEGLEPLDLLSKLKDIEKRAVEEVKKKTDEYVGKTKEIVKIAESAHFNLSVDTSAEDRIKEMLEEENYLGAVNTAREYYENAKKSFDFFFKKLYEIADRIIQEGKGMDVDVKEAEEILRDAMQKYEKGMFEDAVNSIRNATETAEKLKFQKVVELIKKAREVFIEAKSQGIDITPFLKKLDSARDFLKAGRHKRAYEVVLETLDMVERKKNLYEQLKEEVKRIRAAIEELKKEDIILEGVDETVHTIEEEIERNPENAEKMLDELKISIKESLKDIAHTLLSDIEATIEEGDKVELPLEDTKMEVSNVKSLISNENYKDAILLLRRIETDLYEKIAAYARDLEKQASQYEDKRVMGEIKEMKELLDSGDFSGAMKKIARIKDMLFELEGKKYLEKIEEIKMRASKLKEAGGNITEIMSYVERAENAFKQKDIVRVEDYLKRGETTLQTLESQLAKEIFDSAKAMAAAAKRLGVNINKTDILNHLRRAKEHIENGRFLEAIEESQKAKSKSKDLRDRAEKAYSILVSVAKRVAKLKDMGTDVKELAPILLKAKKSYEDNNFNESEKLSRECLEKADALETKAKIESLRKELDAIGKVLTELGLEKEFQKMSREFYTRYEEGKYEGLIPLGEKILSELRDHIETILTDYIGKIETDIYDAKEKGYDIGIDPEDLEKAKDHFIRRNYLDALNILKKIEEKIMSVYERREKLKEMHEKIKGYLDMAVSMGIDVSEFRKRFGEFEKLKDVHEIEKQGKEIIEEIEKSIYKKVRSLINATEKELDNLRRKGEDVTAPEGLLNKARVSLREKKYRDALNYVMKAVGEIEKYEMQKNTAYGILKRLETKIKAMEKIIPKDVEKEYREAKDLFLKGMYQKSIEKAMDISVRLSEIERIIEHIKERNKSIKEIVTKAHRLGADVRDILKTFNAAKEEFKKMNYEKSLRLVDQCYEEAKVLLMESVNKYKGIYSRLTSLIKRLGLEEEFKEDISELDDLFKKGEYEAIKKKLSELKKNLDSKLEEISREKLKEFKEKKEMFQKLKVDAGIDLEDAERKLREYMAKDYTKFFDYLNSLNSKLENAMPALIKEKIDSFKKELDRYEKFGINVDEYHSRLYDILSLMEKKEYHEIYSMLTDMEKNFNRYVEEYIKTLIERVKKRVGEYSEEKAKEFVDRMERMLHVGNYIEALRIYEEAGEFVSKYKVFMEDFGKKIEEVKDRLRFALSLGLKVGNEISELKEIESLSTSDMERARVELENLKAKINEKIEALRPELDIEIEPVERFENRYRVRFKVYNGGSVDAQNVRIEVSGSLNTEKPLEILKIDKMSSEELEAMLNIGEGDKVKITATYSRFDGREYEFSKEIKFKVEEEKKRGFHIEKAKEKVKCALCRGTILPAMNLDIVICDNCGAVYHVPCAKRLGKCKVCGQEFKFD